MAKHMLGGYNGKILRVNLSTNTILTEAIDEPFCRKYLGGTGFATYFLWKELQQGTEPLSLDNKLIFASGPLTGGSLPGCGRHCVGAKSPLTGGIAKAEVGEFWGTELKRAGYDAIIIEGKADKPSYLWVHDGEANIMDASHLWGRNTKETQQAIRDELNDSHIRIAGIGRGGENLVRYACIMHGLYDAAGRGGLGAVMGSKNLKAIGVRGHKAPQISDPERLKKLRGWLLSNLEPLIPVMEFGSACDMEDLNTIRNLPVRNFRDGSFPEVTKIDGPALKKTIRIKQESCFGCPVHCKTVVRVEEPYPVDPAYGGPEYETLAALGSNCGIDDLKAIAKGNELCNAYSLDTISTGSVIAFAMECFESGLLSIKDTNGVELRFGNAEAMLKIIELIAKREGIGDLLAEGTARAAQIIGKGTQEFAMHVKGLELGMHEPRLKTGLGLGYMVNPHGADHVCSIDDPAYVTQEQIAGLEPLGILEPVPTDDIGPRKVALFKLMQLKSIVSDSLSVCVYLPYSCEQLAEATAATTGWNTGVMEQLITAERILTLARLFNIREGFNAKDDRLPQRFFQPTREGPLSNTSLDPEKMEKAKRYYYTLMGWDASTGIPMPEKVEELGIA